jgi:hypothetical protein
LIWSMVLIMIASSNTLMPARPKNKGQFIGT